MDWWMLWAIATALAAYVAGLVTLAWVADYIFGRRGYDFVMTTVGLPTRLLEWLLIAVDWLITSVETVGGWPWRYRNRRLFMETFGFYVPGSSYYQRHVDEVLTKLAISMQRAFDTQEEARKGCWPEIKEVDWVASDGKKRFWKAHALAKKNSYRVYPSYQSYISPPSPPPAIEIVDNLRDA